MVVVGEVSVEEDPMADENDFGGVGDGDGEDVRGIEGDHDDGDDEHWT